MNDWELKPAAGMDLPLADQHRSIAREGGLVESVMRAGWWTFVRSSLKVFHRIDYRGREHLPKQPSFILVANHESHLDAMVIGASLPLRMRNELFPLAAGDLFFERNIIAAFSAITLNALPIWRRRFGKQAMVDLRNRLLSEPCIYILFPEGTRTRTGEMGTFRPGIGMLAAETEVPVIPCFLRGTGLAFPPDQVMPRWRKITMAIGEPMTFKEVPNRREGWNQIAAAVEASVRQLAERQLDQRPPEKCTTALGNSSVGSSSPRPMKSNAASLPVQK